MPDTGNAKDCLELPPTNFSIFTFKNLSWRTYLISFTVLYCFLFPFVCTELVSLIWFVQIWVAIYVYGTMIYWFTLIKKLMQTYIVIVSGSTVNVSTVHLNGIWHLIWRYLSKPVLGRHPLLSGQYSIPRGCLLNTGFTVLGKPRVQERENPICAIITSFPGSVTKIAFDQLAREKSLSYCKNSFLGDFSDHIYTLSSTMQWRWCKPTSMDHMRRGTKMYTRFKIDLHRERSVKS